jgi:hypothetical protein
VGMKLNRELEAKCLELAAKAATVPHTLGLSKTWVLTVPNWHPCPLNKLIGCHHGTAHARRAADQRRLADEMALAGVPEARCRRRVSLRVVLGPRQRACDPDAFWKSTLDALVACRRLVDDSRTWCELGTVEFDRGKKATVVTLEDLT